MTSGGKISTVALGQSDSDLNVLERSPPGQPNVAMYGVRFNCITTLSLSRVHDGFATKVLIGPAGATVKT